MIPSRIGFTPCPRVRRWAVALWEETAEARGHHPAAEAARIAYYGFLSFFPAILLVLAVTGMVGGERAFDRFVSGLRDALPGVASASLQRFVAGVLQTPRPGLLSAGAVLLLWSSSNAFSALTLALNVSFGGGERRSWWRRRALGLLVMAVVAAALAVGSAALVAGPDLLRALGLVGVSGVWSFLKGSAVFAMLTAATYLLYAVLPNVERPRPKIMLLAGAASGMAIWMAATLLFRVALHSFSRSGSVYGVMSGVIAIQIWIHLTALGVLLGAEVAAALERRVGRSDRAARKTPRTPEPHEVPGPPRLRKENP